MKQTPDGSGASATVSISGSTSVGPLAEKLAAKYTEEENYEYRDKSNWFFCRNYQRYKWSIRDRDVFT